ncbi:hypothetical protein K523DRAFT_422137 [Schizophyllum commune Tattone D]|nr:hypothetical protein K523DRAFT_422137 [Schizophyllum commune Tattone D]
MRETSPTLPSFVEASIQQVLYPSETADAAGDDEMEDDLTGKQETFAEDKQEANYSDEGVVDEIKDPHTLVAQVRQFAQGVTEDTDKEYRRMGAQCLDFLVKHKFMSANDPWYCKRPLQHADYFIIAWIMYHCDQVKLDGSVRSVSDPAPYSYSHAMKMRAAMTYIFGHLFGAGVVPWHENEAGIMVGNPSISTVVSRYMVSLRKRKTRAGEQATSARALTPEKLERLYDFNNAVPCTPYTGPTPRASKTDQWMAGGRQRRMLQCIYTIAFSCLLRSDEVLKIKFEHIKVDDDGRKLVLTLLFRKTAQYGCT